MGPTGAEAATGRADGGVHRLALVSGVRAGAQMPHSPPKMSVIFWRMVSRFFLYSLGSRVRSLSALNGGLPGGDATSERLEYLPFSERSSCPSLLIQNWWNSSAACGWTEPFRRPVAPSSVGTPSFG